MVFDEDSADDPLIVHADSWCTSDDTVVDPVADVVNRTLRKSIHSALHTIVVDKAPAEHSTHLCAGEVGHDGKGWTGQMAAKEGPPDVVARVNFLEDKVRQGIKAQRALQKTRDLLQVANQELAHSRHTNRKLQDANNMLTKQAGSTRKDVKQMQHKYHTELETYKAEVEERYADKCQECDYLAARLRKADDRWRRHVEDRRWRHREGDGGSAPALVTEVVRVDHTALDGRPQPQQRALVQDFSRKVDDLASVGRMCSAVQKKISSMKGLEREENLLAKIGNVVQSVEESTRLVVAEYLGNPAKRRRNQGEPSSPRQPASFPGMDPAAVAKQAAVTYGVAPARERRAKQRSRDSVSSMIRSGSLPAIVHGGRSPPPPMSKCWR